MLARAAASRRDAASLRSHVTGSAAWSSKGGRRPPLLRATSPVGQGAACACLHTGVCIVAGIWRGVSLASLLQPLQAKLCGRLLHAPQSAMSRRAVCSAVEDINYCCLKGAASACMAGPPPNGRQRTAPLPVGSTLPLSLLPPARAPLTLPTRRPQPGVQELTGKGRGRAHRMQVQEQRRAEPKGAALGVGLRKSE